MKKVILLLVLAMSTLFALAQNGRIDLRSESRAEITKSEFSKLSAVFSYGSIESVEVSTARGLFSDIAIEGTYPSGEIGSPQLPASHQLLAVPFGATPRVTVTNFSYTDYDLASYGIRTLMPHQPSVSKDQRPEDVEFVYNAAAYQTRGLASAPEATIEVQGTMRGIQVGSLVINPVSYNPASNTLRVFNNIEVDVNFDGADRNETERMLLSTYSPYFDIVYKQMFNYRQIMDVYSDHPDLMAYPVRMIVVAPDNYVTALQPWLNWKTQKGFYITLVTTSQAGSNYNAIRTYVQNLYNTGVNQGATPTFLILVGDTGQIPGTNGSSSGKVTDLYYGSVDGDYFPDMFYSRMSAESTTQLTAIINKILQYEQYTMPDPSYLNKVLLIAGQDNTWNPTVAQPTINYATTYYYNTAHGFSNVYAYLSSYSNCYNNLSTGVGFANYTAHGSETGWSGPSFSNSNVNSLTNTNKYFLAMGNCCLTGNFGYSSACFGETLIRAENKGAYSYIGSCPVTYWYEDYYFGVGAHNTHGGATPTQSGSSTGCYDGVWMDNTYHTVSSMVFLGNLAVCYAHTGGYQTHSNPTYYWQAYHVLGDGSIMPFRVQPSPNNVSHGSTFPAGATSFPVSAQEGSYVAISQNNVLKGVALVPASGTVNVPVEAGITTGQVRIVVTKPQRQPYIQDINVSSAQSYTITVSANPTNGGTVTGGGTFATGSTRTVTATANANYTFVNWTENGAVVSTNASYTFVLNYNRNLVANFALPTFTITATADPAIGGSVNVGRNRTDLTYNFENGSYQGWTVLKGNAGTSPNNWMHNTEYVAYDSNGNLIDVSTGHNSSNGFMLSESYISATTSGGTAYGAVYPDNYLVSPQILLGGSITFYASSRMSNYPAEKFAVVVSESGNNSASNFNHTELIVTLPDNEWHTYTVDLSAYSGLGYVAIRHYDCYDQHLLYIDDITIVEGEDPSNASGTFNLGETCVVSATPSSGYHFVNWTENGSAVSTNASYSFTVTSNRNLVAHFSNQTQTYSVSVSANPTNGGTATGGGSFSQGQSCTVVATANNGYQFTNWTENGSIVSTNANYTFSVTGNHNLVANFTQLNYTISVSANPTAGGSVTGGGSNFHYGDNCTVTATPSNGYQFTNWTENGNVVSTSASYTFTVYDSRTLVAHFTQQNYTISVSANPNNGGTVTGGGAFHYGDNCTVVATPSNGYSFTNWTENGNVVSTNASYTFSVTGNRTLVAHFQAPQSYTITATANPTNGGTATGGGTFTQGQSCTLTATPAAGYSFVRWTKNGTQVSTNATYTFTVTESAAYVAQFELQSFTISVSANPSNAGTVSGGGTYEYGASCTVVATPHQRYEFVNWTENGNVVSNNASYTFTVTANRTLVANFGMPQIQITASVDPEEAASVHGAGSYNYGDVVTLTLTPNTNWHFLNWTETGVMVCEEMTYTFTATENRHLVAHLEYTEGIGEQDGSQTLIYPNPVNDKLTVETQESIRNLEIYNITGALMYSQKDCGNKVEIHTSDLSSGIYFIRLTTNKVSETRRFVKK